MVQSLRAKWLIIIIIYHLITRVVWAPQMISQPVSSIFPCFPLPSGTWRTPGMSIPWCCLPTSFFCLPCLLPPFTVPFKMVLAGPDEQEMCPYHFSLHLFTMVRRSLCGPISCWILAQTSSLVTWSLYVMHPVGILQSWKTFQEFSLGTVLVVFTFCGWKGQYGNSVPAAFAVMWYQ